MRLITHHRRRQSDFKITTIGLLQVAGERITDHDRHSLQANNSSDSCRNAEEGEEGALAVDPQVVERVSDVEAEFLDHRRSPYLAVTDEWPPFAVTGASSPVARFSFRILTAA